MRFCLVKQNGSRRHALRVVGGVPFFYFGGKDNVFSKSI
nr:MAG TPA: hypothetical protein [Bacteriophage sp.]